MTQPIAKLDLAEALLAQESERPCLLMVDDDPGSLRLLAELLGDSYTVLVGTRGADALALVAEGPELILLDLRLPDIDGLEVCRRLKADPLSADIPVIFITGHHDAALEVQGLQAGAVDFITKPFTPAVLLARVKTHIALKRKTDLLAYLAHRDSLTGLANRDFFEQALAKEWARARRYSLPLALAVIDVDHFTALNTRWGQAEGDHCLRSVAQISMRHLRRPGDLMVRYQGGAFALLMPHTDAAGASQLAERIRSHVEAAFASMAEARGDGPGVTVSLGCASIVPSGDEGPEVLLRQAEHCLSLAKSLGRNRVEPPP